MKTSMTEKPITRSVDIQKLRVAQELKRATRKQSYAIPAEIAEKDISWRFIFRVAASILGVVALILGLFVLVTELFTLIILYGAQF